MPRSLKWPRFIAAASAAVLLAASAAMPASAQVPEPGPYDPGPEADLSLDFSVSDRAPLVGDPFEFDLQISNDGPEDADDVFVYAYISESMSVSDLPSDCTSDSYGGISCSLGDLDDGEQADLSFESTRTRAREAWMSFSASSSNYDPAYENNYGELYVGPDTSNPADIGVTIDAPADPEIGERFTYEIEVDNDGPQEAQDVEMRDALPPGVELISWDSGSDDCSLREEEPYVESSDGETSDGESRPAYVYRELQCSLGTLLPGAEVGIAVVVERVDPYELWNSAWVMTASYDSNYENDYAYATTAPDESVTSDLAVEVDGPAGVPLVGESFELEYTVGNEGPAPTNDAALVGYLPDGLQFESATSQDEGVECSSNDIYGGGGSVGAEDDARSVEPAPSEPTSGDAPRSSSPIYYGGGGFNCALGALAPGDSVTVVMSATRSKARETWATASVWSMNYDQDYEDNYAETPIPADTSNPADVSVSMDAPDDAEVGDEVEFDIEVTNNGPMEARSVVVTDVLPFGLDLVAATPADGSDTCFVDEQPPYAEMDGGKAVESDSAMWWGYRQVRCELGSLGVGESNSVSVTATRSTEYEVWNSAYAETSSYDPNYDNDYASALLEGERQPCGPQPLGGKGADDIAGYDCPVESGAGADSIVVQADSKSRDVDVSAGRGQDIVTLNVPSGSNRSRRIEVKTGPGADQIRVVVAPNAANASIFIHAGSGTDNVMIDAPVMRDGLSIVIIGGGAADTITPFANSTMSQGSWPDGLRMRGGAGADVLTGGYADDRLWGGPGRDVLDGGGGDDSLKGGRGVDSCDGGPGRDDTNC